MGSEALQELTPVDPADLHILEETAVQGNISAIGSDDPVTVCRTLQQVYNMANSAGLVA